MLQPAVVIVISWLMVKFFIFCSLMSFLIQEKLNICGGGEDQPFRDPTTATETVCEETKSLKETNSETFYWSVSNLNKCPGGSHLSFTPPRSCCCFYCSSRSNVWTPSGAAFLQNTKRTFSYIPLYIPRITNIKASTSSPIFPRLLYELLPTLGAATLGVLQGAILR